MKKINLFMFMCFSISMFFMNGCGYTSSSIIAGDAKSICVSSFINKIDLTKEASDKRMYVGYRSGMELDITKETIDRFILDGNLRVTSRDDADLILQGELIDFKKEALRYDSNDSIIEFRIKAVVDIKLINEDENKVLWEEKNFTGESTYRTTGEYAKSEDAALRDAVKDLANRIVERTVEGW